MMAWLLHLFVALLGCERSCTAFDLLHCQVPFEFLPVLLSLLFPFLSLALFLPFPFSLLSCLPCPLFLFPFLLVLSFLFFSPSFFLLLSSPSPFLLFLLSLVFSCTFFRFSPSSGSFSSVSPRSHILKSSCTLWPYSFHGEISITQKIREY